MSAVSKVAQENVKGRSRVVTGTRVRGIGGINEVSGIMALFYRQAAEKSADPEAKMTFLSMADEEQRQIEALGPMPAAGGEERSVISSMISSLERSERAIIKKIKTSTNEIEALTIAMEMEKENIRFYVSLLCRIEDPVQKVIARRLLEDEQERYTKIENTFQFLSASDSWYLWNEQGCADGGTPWA